MKLRALQLRSTRITALLVAFTVIITGQITVSLLGNVALASPIWLPAGVALGALLVWGEPVWWGIFIGDMLLVLLLRGSLILAIGSSIGSTIAAVLGYKILKFLRFSPHLEKLTDVAYLLLIAVITPNLNATIDLSMKIMAGDLAYANFGSQWWIFWLGDCVGILLVVPLLLRLRFATHGLLKRKFRLREAVICLSLLTGVSWLVFASKPQLFGENLGSTQYLEYLPFPFAVWAAIRFRTWGAVAGSLLLSLIALFGTLHGTGPFAFQSLSEDQGIILVQIFIVIVIATTLLLSAAVSERERAERQLRSTLKSEKLLGEIALRIRQSLDLDEIFQRAVTEVRQLLKADRVHIGYVNRNNQAEIVAESVNADYPSLLGWQPHEALIKEIESLLEFRETLVIEDVENANISTILKDNYEKNQVKSILAVTLVSNGEILGLLVAHQCSRPRIWQEQEVRLLEQLATQVAIAIQQAKLYSQVQLLNSTLESQVAERTQQLEDKVREVQAFYEMKTVFLQAVSHDLRTSVMGLLMLLKNLRNRPGDNIVLSRSILESIINSGDRQLTLIEALAEVHLGARRPLSLDCHPLTIKNLLEKIQQDWQLPFAQNQGQLKITIPENLPLIYGDHYQLQSVFEQLLDNALKHNRPGIEVLVEVKKATTMLQFSVSDNGLGMSQQQCHQLFKLYVRNIYNKRLTGVGLGLYQCRQIIEAHGGKIGVQSQPGQGSQFWFTVPFMDNLVKTNQQTQTGLLVP